MKKLILILLLVATNSVRSQTDSELLKQLTPEDSVALNALALYPENVRNSIYEACVYPDVLVKTNAMQQTTSEKFYKLINYLDREEQEEVWDLTRYPDLIPQLVSGGKKTEKHIREILRNYPEEIHETAIKYGRQNYNLLQRITELYDESDVAYREMLKEYPSSTQNALYELVKYPEIITILNDHMKLTVIVGNLYKKNPAFVKKYMNDLSIEVARKNAQEFEDYKNGLEKNPHAKAEMEAAAKEYAREQGYEEDEMIVQNETVIINYVTYPYPYWFGYPHWYNDPFWYPYPYWYHWGFYYSPYGIVYFGMPSWYYMNWYYYYYPHYYYYPNYTDYCVSHYYGHRSSTSAVSGGTRQWIRENESVLPDNYFSNPVGRVERIKELGKFDKEYHDYIRQNPTTSITRDEFLTARKEKYPTIQTPAGKRTNQPSTIQPRRPEVAPQQKRPPVKLPTDRPGTPPPAQPRREAPRKETPRVNPQPRPQPQPTPRPAPQPRRQTPPPRREASNYKSYELFQAINYHSGTWTTDN